MTQKGEIAFSRFDIGDIIIRSEVLVGLLRIPCISLQLQHVDYAEEESSLGCLTSPYGLDHSCIKGTEM